MKKISLLVSILVIFIPLKLMAAKAMLSVDRNDLSLNETFTIDVTIKDALGKVFLPKIDGIDILSTGKNSNMRIINGKVTEEVSFSFVAIAKKEGKIKIPSFKVKTNKGILNTNELILDIKSASKTSIPGKESLLVKAVISDDLPYISEKIEYKIIVYSDETVVRIGFEEPKFSGFIANRKKDKTYTQVVAGKAYSITEIIYDLVPVQVGKGEISPTKVEAGIRYSNRSNNNNNLFLNDPFFSSSFSTKRKMIFTNRVKYKVKDLPKTDLTSFFTNIVGKIEGYSVLDKNSLASDDFLNYKIIIKGNGNLDELKLPELNLSNDYKAYKDEPKFELMDGEKGKKGSVISGYAIVPTKPGNYSIPGFKLRFFNTEKELWQEIEIDEKKFEVSGKGDNQKNIAPILPENEKKKVIKKQEKNMVKKGYDILFVKDKKESVYSNKPDYKRFFVLSFIPVFIFGFSFFIKNYFSNYLISLIKHQKSRYFKKIDEINPSNDIKVTASSIKIILNEYLLEHYNENLSSYLTNLDLDTKKDLKTFIDELDKIEFSMEVFDIDKKDLMDKTKEFIKRL